MAKGYSTDLRARAVALVEAGESRREVARLLDLAASTTIAGWIGGRQPVTSRRSLAPATATRRSSSMNNGCSIVAAEPDLTLDEIGTRLASAKKLTVGRTRLAVLRSTPHYV